MASFPTVRPRRLRRTKAIRNLVAETDLDPSHFIYPLFVKEGIEKKEPIESMPGQYRYPVNEELVNAVRDALEVGVKSFILFGIPKEEEKDEMGSAAYKEDGVVPRAIKLLRKEFGSEIVIAADVCLCHYTTHGHCGLLKKGACYKEGDESCYYIDNDDTIKLLGKVALAHAKAGADIVAPSSMMDGMVKAIREALDSEGFKDVMIMSYSVKYASGFYGPFRAAAHNAPQIGDRRSYQMDPRNALEALKEVELDLQEGADIVMVKPALAYLDVIRLVKGAFPHVPLAAYNVSGEYSMVKFAAQNGLIDEKKVTLEVLTSIRRAGADIIITYHAVEAAKWIREGLHKELF